MIMNIDKFMCVMDNVCGCWKGIKQVVPSLENQTKFYSFMVAKLKMCIFRYAF
jgi:hypothetical protein